MDFYLNTEQAEQTEKVMVSESGIGIKQEDVRDYYGETLSSSSDLKTNACCTTESIPSEIKEIISQLNSEVVEKFYGCGSPIPPLLSGLTVLDLGCGSGRDCFVLSKLVGAEGRVIGVDMTEQQLSVGKRHLEEHAKLFGYAKSNVEFKAGYIEDLKSLGIADNSVDLVISNCVVNLSPAKNQVFSEIFRVLKPGGELYFSDVFSTRRIPEELVKDPVLVGECLAGALYIEDFRRILAKVGCLDFRIVSDRELVIGDDEIEKKIGMIPFRSMTVRAFKVSLEDRCEDFGQVAYYKGTIPDCPHSFILDNHHEFITGKPHLVCGNTAAMLSESRLAAHFRVEGSKDVHFGLFNCAPEANPANEENAPGGCC